MKMCEVSSANRNSHTLPSAVFLKYALRASYIESHCRGEGGLGSMQILDLPTLFLSIHFIDWLGEN